MDFLEKLNLLMKRDNYNKNSLSKASGIPYTTIDNWYKRGYDNLQLPTVKRLCSFFNTSLDFWLKEEVTDPDYGKAMGFEITLKEMEHIKKYRTLDPRSQSHVDTVLEWEAERVKQLQLTKKPLGSPTATIIEIQPRPVTNVRLTEYFHSASAGAGVFILGNESTEKISVPATPENEIVDYVIKVSGNSMEPDYHDGDNVMVSQKLEMNRGDVGIFVVNGNAYIKEYGETELISRNPDADNIRIAEYDNIVCMGKVVGKLEEPYEITSD